MEALKVLKSEKASIERRLQIAILSNSSNENGNAFANKDAFRQAVINTLERRLFYTPSFKIYGGVAGLFDYGPPGCAVKSNVLAFWRQHFVSEENMLEVNSPYVTPEIVLKASGHVDKFTDLMVKDEKTRNCYHADHLLKDFCKDKLEKDLNISAEKEPELKHVLAALDDLSAEELGAKIREYGITAPDTKNPLSAPYPFNLMFQTLIGPSGLSPGSVLVLISPRQGLLRVREFTLAEIEHFVDPDDKSHPKFSKVANLEFLMFPGEVQVSGQSARRIPLGEAFSMGIVNNETLGYFIGRVYLFLICLGIDKEQLNFRQHLANEMAHYAADCWDAEIECFYGQIECVGIADRSAYDLRAHMDKSGVSLVAHENFAETREVEDLVITPMKKELGLAFRGNQKAVIEALEAMDEREAMEMKAVLESQGEVWYRVCRLDKDVIIKKNRCLVIFKERERTSKGLYTISTSIGKRYARTDELGVPLAITVDSTSSVTVRKRDSKVQIRVAVGEVASIIKEVTDGQSTWKCFINIVHQHLCLTLKRINGF
ncbi:hypothetical protein P3X46_030771 [Hevea brasiliensis]|uniref:Anticodon-binding domain-containing protein n=1 Tax=Hevea brasiliensis TaxID=3981 RepID=A0ABQ9KIA5_HEVBR|nr:hypothetical protein P3X46_030771 [Hevea brasiliensis]